MKYVLTIVFTYVLVSLSAQQAPQFSTYMLNPYAYNPASAGLGQTLVGTVAYRKQWTDLPNAPETVHANVHFPMGIIPSGIGLQLETDALGAHRINRASLAFNYQFGVGERGRLSIGAAAGFLQFRLDGSQIRTPQGQYEPNVFLHNDDFLPEGTAQANTPYVEAGLLFELSRLQLGLSALPVFAPALQFSEKNGINYALRQHFVAQASYEFEIGEGHSLWPSALVKTDGAQTQTEISALFAWRGNILLGSSFRGVTSSSRDAVALLLGSRVNPKTTIAYSYDIPLSALKAAQRGSHEILLRYDLGKTLGKGNLPPVVYNPRFY